MILEDIYLQHHIGRMGHTEVESIRGELFRKAIGTGKTILDVGCRDGTLTKHFTKDNTVLGVDIDSKALEIASKLGIITRQIDLNGEWDMNRFDVVVVAEVIEHLYFPDEVMSKISRALNPNGLLVGSVPNAFSLPNRLRYLMGIKKGTPMSDPTHINHFSYKELDKLLNRFFIDVKITRLSTKALFFTAHKKPTI